MKSKELRKKYLSFFEEKKHKIVPSSSLLPKDPSVLFTTAGMQQFKPYYLGQESPYGKNTASCQKCFRSSDIEEVGDERHLTFFEMLGNFSFGGYFKKEAIELAKEFLDFLGITIEYVTVFEGDKNTPKDKESAEIWQKLGFSEEKGNLKFYSKEENFWGPTGQEGPCGPTTEIYASGIEVWNIVFNQYYYKDKKLEKLETPGIDTGMGLERLAKVAQNKETIFETDLFEPIIKEIKSLSQKEDKKALRIIADHIKAATFILSENIEPSNVEQGYVLRRLIRRSVRYAKQLGIEDIFCHKIAKTVIELYKNIYPELRDNQDFIFEQFIKEEEKFQKTIERGLREFEKLDEITGKKAFDLYQNYGFPLELTEELAEEKGIKLNKEEFKMAFDHHQEVSRKGAELKFKGGLADHSEKTTKYHTATHLLLASLRKILGDHVFQKGSNITAERLRFDFSHKEKLTKEQIEKIENLVNQKIGEDLEVKSEEMPLDEAKKQGVMGVFGEKYGAKVKVYTIGDFSKEICGGPHVKRTSELGHFKIIKEESSSSGVRRIRAVLE